MPARPINNPTPQDKPSGAEVRAESGTSTDSRLPESEGGEGTASGARAATDPTPLELHHPITTEQLASTIASHLVPEAAVNGPSLEDAATVFLDYLPPDNQRAFVEFCRQNKKSYPAGMLMALSMVTDHPSVMNRAAAQEQAATRMSAPPTHPLSPLLRQGPMASYQQGQASQKQCGHCGKFFPGTTTYCSDECGGRVRWNAMVREENDRLEMASLSAEVKMEIAAGKRSGVAF